MTALVVVTLDPGTLTAIVVGVASLVASIGYLVKKLRALFRILTVVETVVERELEGNHGSSIKDDVLGIAHSVGNLSRELDELRDCVDDHITRTEGGHSR